jgi:hypothetical protein
VGSQNVVANNGVSFFWLVVQVETNNLRASLGSFVKQHIASSTSDCLGKLAAYDLLKEHLPVSFGGTWTGCEPWHVGVNRRLPLPIVPDVTCLIRNTLWYYTHSTQAGSGAGSRTASYPAVAGYAAAAAAGAGGHLHTDDDSMADEGARPYSSSKEDEAKKRTRRERHAVNSRQRRAKEKIEHEVMFQEYLRQKEMNDALRGEQVRLERLVQTANQVSTTETDNSNNNNNDDDNNDNTQN